MAWWSPYLQADGPGDGRPHGLTDYVLRAGESLTWHYQPQNRFCLPAQGGQDSAEPLPFISSKDTPGPIPPYDNLCIRWQPDLRADLDDVEVDISCDGFEREAIGLRAQVPTATIRYRLAAPCQICGRYEGFYRAGPRMDGLLVRVNASASPILTLHTPQNGQTAPIPLDRDACEHFADLTHWADQQQEYELSLSLPQDQTLRSILVETWCHTPRATLPAWCEPGRVVRLATGKSSQPTQRPQVAPPTGPLDLLLRWRHDGKLRTFRKRLTPTDIGQPFVPIPEAGVVQPLHMVLSARSRQ